MIVVGGGLRRDYLITHTGEARTGVLGGNALYAAVGAALWVEDDVLLWARMGANYPRAQLAPLAQHGIDARGLVAAPGDQDHRTFYAYTTADGRRHDTDPAAHFARIGQPLPDELRGYVHSTPQQADPDGYEPLALRPEDWPADLARGEATAVHLAPLPLATHRRVVPHLRALGVGPITVDPGERYMVPARAALIRELLPQVDAFLPSDQEARSLFGAAADLWRAAETLGAWGAPVVVVKHGAAGALVYERKSGRRTHLPAFHAPGDGRIVDVTGAGDSFCGAFCAGLARAGDPLYAARLGIIAASLVIEGYGALYALERGRAEARARLGEYEGVRSAEWRRRRRGMRSGAEDGGECGMGRGRGAGERGGEERGARSEGARSEGARSEGARSEGARGEGARGEGARSEGARSEGARGRARGRGARGEERGGEERGGEERGSEERGSGSEGARSEGARSEGAGARGRGARGRVRGRGFYV
jgi:sugar/nucleoside kinase (ribokinase family)